MGLMRLIKPSFQASYDKNNAISLSCHTSYELFIQKTKQKFAYYFFEVLESSDIKLESMR